MCVCGDVISVCVCGDVNSVCVCGDVCQCGGASM